MVMIRAESEQDYQAVFAVHAAAFGREDEARLVEELRNSAVIAGAFLTAWKGRPTENADSRGTSREWGANPRLLDRVSLSMLYQRSFKRTPRRAIAADPSRFRWFSYGAGHLAGPGRC